MLHVSSSSSQPLVVKLGLGLASLAQGGGRNLDERLGGVLAQNPGLQSKSTIS